MRHLRTLSTASGIAFLLTIALAGSVLAGPIVLMGIDGEDGNGASGSGHGGKTPYLSVAAGFLAGVTNGGSGILVIGGGKSPTDNVTEFWAAIGTGVGEAVTNVNGAAAITLQSFAGFAMIAVASSTGQTPSGGLTDSENGALNARAADIATHVNGGGSLFGLSQTGLSNPYGYLGDIGGGVTTNVNLGYAAVTSTLEGQAVGITDTNLDVCCWHDEYVTFPAFLDVLATNDSSGLPAAVGGLDVLIPGEITLEPLIDLNPIGSDHTVSATVVDGDPPFGPLVGIDVTFDVISGPNTGETGIDTTDVSGIATFTYTGSGGAGVDIIEASFTDPDTGGTIVSNTVRKFWDNDCQPNNIADTCDVDCNGFGGECAAVLGCGGSADANNDGLPDECEGPCGCMDVALVVDDTGSMGGAIANVVAGLNGIITSAQLASGGDLRMSLVSFKDTVTVDQGLTTVIADVQTAVNALFASGGAGFPESSDQGLRVAVTDTSACGPTGAHGVFRAGCLNVAVLVTDADPGGCDDNFTAGVDDVEADAVANLAAAAGVKIVAVRVGAVAQAPILQNYATVTGGVFTTVPSDGSGLATAIETILTNCVGGCGDDAINGNCVTGTAGAACSVDADCDTLPGAGDGTCVIEECDGTDDALCPGLCRPAGNALECTCQECGDGILDPSEDCDEGAGNGACSDLSGCADPVACPVVCDVQVACAVNADCPPSEVSAGKPASTCEGGVCQINCANHRFCKQQFGIIDGCLGTQTCDATCMFERQCVKMGRDPASIRFRRNGKPDTLRIHAALAVLSEQDPVGEGFRLRISNVDGLVYEGVLLQNDLVASRNGKRMKYRDNSARAGGQHRRNGLSQVVFKRRTRNGKEELTFRLKAYGDLSNATHALMLTHVQIGDDGSALEAEWRQTGSGWKLRQVDLK